MPVKLKGATSGDITLDVPAVAGTNTLTLPAKTGNLITSADTGTVTPTMLSQKLTQMTTLAYNWNGLTTNTVLDFTGIPSWAKRITVMLAGISSNGSSPPRIRIGTGGTPATSGYVGSTAIMITGTSISNLTAGFDVQGALNQAGNIFSGTVTLVEREADVWVCSASMACSGAGNAMIHIAGYVSLAGALDVVRLTTVNGTDTFDAGTVNVMYEG